MEPDDDELRSVTGRVVIRNSDLSFVRPRRAMTEIGVDELKVNVPKGRLPELNGDSLRNAANCAFGPSVNVPAPKSTPLEFVKKNEIVAVWPEGFAIAIPVSTGVFTS